MSTRANFFYYPARPCALEPVYFIDVTPEAPLARSWRFGDGSEAAGAWPTHRFDREGDYDVELIVHTTAGDVASVTRTVRVARSG